MKPAARERVTAATVRFLRQGGQGILVPGHLIITAAHVLPWSLDGAMVLDSDGREAREEIAAADGRRLVVVPFAVEPVTDIAILGAMDEQEFPKQAEAFADFCEVTTPVRLSTTERPQGAAMPVHILAHTGQWIAGQCMYWLTKAPVLNVVTREPIEGGTSGGPVVTDGGLLLGVVSNSGADAARAPRPHLTAPVWLVERMVGGQKGLT